MTDHLKGQELVDAVAREAAYAGRDWPCLSIKQPWAELIVAGVKNVENRSWAPRYRGPLLIHTGQKPSADWHREVWSRLFVHLPRAAYEAARAHLDPGPPLGTVTGKVLPLGAIVGAVYLTGYVHWTAMRPGGPWHETWRTAWRLERPLRFTRPVPYRGALHLFNVPGHGLDRQLTEFMDAFPNALEEVAP